MSRTLVTMREAEAGDVAFLLDLWGADVLRRADCEDQCSDLELILKESADSAERRLVVAEYDGEPAGAVLLRLDTMSPLNLEPVVQALAPHVLPSFRRRGIGSSLMEAAVAWAEELGVGHVATAATASSRSGNRFMARLSLSPRAVQRASTTHAVRYQLLALQPASRRVTGRRPLGQVLVARRQLHRRTPDVHPVTEAP